MLNEESTIFPKQIKIDDYQPSTDANILRIMESSNLLLGNGGRASHAAIILAKCLHFLHDQNTFNFSGKRIIELGCGVGVVGIYLGCLGAHGLLTDLPPMKDMVERNININRDKLKGKLQYGTLNWKKPEKEQQMMDEEEEGPPPDHNYLKELETMDYTVVCEGGNIDDLELQLKWMGKKGMFLAFMHRSYDFEQFMNASALEAFLLKEEYQYERIENYHPDYQDERVSIYHIWK